ncbi:thioredoxin family protein [Jiulongibacter sediminis]|uniref:thioredoxin family protein n=1 Tax=Jiulongibacter sediminis TaxID=1605367 RepID=UPI0009EA4BFA|nr:thioredoxin family protein [Jiulongibacter sediminis]
MNKKNLTILGLTLAVAMVGTFFFKGAKAKSIFPVENKTIALNPTVEDGYEVGDEATDFSLKNIDGKMVSLADFSAAKGFIVVFTCNHCPFSKAYEDRIVALDAKYSSKGYPVIAINPNDPAAYEEDSFENMKKRAAEKGFTYPYLLDEKGIGQQYGAARTPHVFVLKKEGGKNIVKYIGAIDDSAQDPAGVSKKYVESAVDNLLQDKPVVTKTTKAIGCSIRWRSDS